jgi:hypothetical protein
LTESNDPHMNGLLVEFEVGAGRLDLPASFWFAICRHYPLFARLIERLIEQYPNGREPDPNGCDDIYGIDRISE